MSAETDERDDELTAPMFFVDFWVLLSCILLISADFNIKKLRLPEMTQQSSKQPIEKTDPIGLVLQIDGQLLDAANQPVDLAKLVEKLAQPEHENTSAELSVETNEEGYGDAQTLLRIQAAFINRSIADRLHILHTTSPGQKQ